MANKCELVGYRVPNLMYDVQIKDRTKKARQISFENHLRLSMSEKEPDRALVSVQTRASDADGEIKYAIEVQGIFRILDADLTMEERDKVLKEEGFEALYAKMREVLENVEKAVGQKLPPLPDQKDMTLE